MWLEDRVRITAIRQSIAIGAFVGLVCYIIAARFVSAVGLLGNRFPTSSQDWKVVSDAFALLPGPFWGAVLGIFTLYALYGLSRSVPAALSPATSPLSRRLQSEEPGRSFSDISQRLEAEYRSTPRDRKLVGSDHCFLFSLLSIDIRPLDDLVWCYPTKTTTYAFGFLPIGRGYSITFCFKSSSAKASIAKGAIERVLGEVKANRPWIIVGYDRDIESAWRGSRARLITASEEGRRKFHRQSSAG